MRNPATPSADQFLVLLTVVDTGGFTAAAKRLRRASSAISYAIDTLERNLGHSRRSGRLLTFRWVETV